MKRLIVSAIVITGLSIACHAQTGDYLYNGSEQTITLNPGIYEITAFGAQGGLSADGVEQGGLGAEMTAVRISIVAGGKKGKK